jgi:hypothetical protein
MDLKEIGLGGMGCIEPTQDRDQWKVLVNTVVNLRVEENVEKFLSREETGCFSRRSQLHGVCLE